MADLALRYDNTNSITFIHFLGEGYLPCVFSGVSWFFGYSALYNFCLCLS